MFLSFECSNSFSYQDITRISSVARKPYVYEGKQFEILPIKKGGDFIWPVLSIYGPNASGKSTFLRSLSTMIKNVCGHKRDLMGETFHSKAGYIEHELGFVLPQSDEDSDNYFVYKYGYKIDVDEQSVVEEWLKSKVLDNALDSEDGFENVFYRTGPCSDDIELFNGKIPNIAVAEVLKSKVRKNGLFLSLFWDDETESQPFSMIGRWFTSITLPESFFDTPINMEIKCLVDELKKSQEFKGKFLKFLQEVDDSIIGINVIGRELKVIHRKDDFGNDDDLSAIVSFDKESSGTRKMAVMYPRFINALTNGGLLIVDELDTKLHFDALIAFVMLFRKEINTKAQLIFSSHNAATLKRAYVHQDEVFFVDKFDDGKSILGQLDLTNLSDEDMEKDFDVLFEEGTLGATRPSMMFG